MFNPQTPLENKINLAVSFGFFIGGVMGHSFRLNISQGHLYCDTIGPYHSAQIRQPVASIIENESWNEMIDYLATRKWKSKYDDKSVLDGTHWRLLVRTTEVRICSSGVNAYPPGFQKFIKLLNDVIEVEGLEVG